MNVRLLYLLASALWALVLAPLAVAAAVGVSAGIAWIYLFGDNPWPPLAQSVILVLGVLAGLLTAAAAIWMGYRRGKGAHSLRNANAPTGWGRASALLAPPVLLALLVMSFFWIRERNYRQAMTTAATQEAASADLVEATKKITGLSVTINPQDIGRAAVRISGVRAGGYRLSWQIFPSTVNRTLVSGDRTLNLAPADEEVPIMFAIDDLRKRYQAIVLAGRGGALIDELFHLKVVLDPVLTEEERLKLPPGELRRLGTSESPLQSQQNETFPMRFTVTN